jgi:hypothetical protein
MQLWNQGNSVGFRLVIGLGAEYSASAPIVPQGTTASGAGGTMVPMGGPSAPERRAEVSEKCGLVAAGRNDKAAQAGAEDPRRSDDPRVIHAIGVPGCAMPPRLPMRKLKGWRGF